MSWTESPFQAQSAAPELLGHVAVVVSKAALTQMTSDLFVANLTTALSFALLFLFLIPATYLFHNPVGLVAQARMMQQIQLMKNLAIMGGLLMVFAFGPGPASVDVGMRRPRGPLGWLFGERPLGA